MARKTLGSIYESLKGPDLDGGKAEKHAQGLEDASGDIGRYLSDLDEGLKHRKKMSGLQLASDSVGAIQKAHQTVISDYEKANRSYKVTQINQNTEQKIQGIVEEADKIDSLLKRKEFIDSQIKSTGIIDSHKRHLRDAGHDTATIEKMTVPYIRARRSTLLRTMSNIDQDITKKSQMDIEMKMGGVYQDSFDNLDTPIGELESFKRVQTFIASQDLDEATKVAYENSLWANSAKGRLDKYISVGNIDKASELLRSKGAKYLSPSELRQYNNTVSTAKAGNVTHIGSDIKFIGAAKDKLKTFEGSNMILNLLADSPERSAPVRVIASELRKVMSEGMFKDSAIPKNLDKEMDRLVFSIKGISDTDKLKLSQTLTSIYDKFRDTSISDRDGVREALGVNVMHLKGSHKKDAELAFKMSLGSGEYPPNVTSKYTNKELALRYELASADLNGKRLGRTMSSVYRDIQHPNIIKEEFKKGKLLEYANVVNTLYPSKLDIPDLFSEYSDSALNATDKSFSPVQMKHEAVLQAVIELSQEKLGKFSEMSKLDKQKAVRIRSKKILNQYISDKLDAYRVSPAGIAERLESIKRPDSFMMEP